MNEKLYDLLTESELNRIKHTTEVRNVYVKDLTVSELKEIYYCISNKKLLQLILSFLPVV